MNIQMGTWFTQSVQTIKRYASLTNGWMRIRVKGILLWILDPLKTWWKNTALAAIQAVVKFDYRWATGIAMWAIKKRWWILLNKMPARRELEQWKAAYWSMFDDWDILDKEYKLLYAKHMDLLDDLRYWETKHAKVLTYVEKQMEMKEGDIFK